MKKYIIVFILVLCGAGVNAQREPVYKYTYSFSQPANAAKPYIIIDSFTNTSGLTSMSGQVKNDTGGQVIFPVIWLQQNNKNKSRYFGGEDGRIDTTINPGRYHISVNAIGYKSFDTSFSVGSKTAFHFHVILTPDPMFTIYDIQSKKKLTPQEIDKIKACVFKKDNWWNCSKKGVYYIMVEI